MVDRLSVSKARPLNGLYHPKNKISTYTHKIAHTYILNLRKSSGTPQMSIKFSKANFHTMYKQLEKPTWFKSLLWAHV